MSSPPSGCYLPSGGCSVSIHVELIVGLFSAAECRYLQLLAAPWLELAMNYAATGEGVRDPHRDSDNMVIAPMTEDLVVQAISRCIANASETEVTWGEPLHILRYAPGQQYLPHHDAHAFAPVKKRRIATALLYLNDAYAGGETTFPNSESPSVAGSATCSFCTISTPPTCPICAWFTLACRLPQAKSGSPPAGSARG
ncbi:MAG: 2OG-Fe(II) oxygenase [Sphingomonas bacterium]|nr:2OG-Fe(II) oxygenase [Sphingomonas bacterium]